MKKGIAAAILICALTAPLHAASGEELLDIAQAELRRNFEALQQRADPKPYYLSYEITDRETEVVDASLGALRTTNSSRQRVLDVSVRVGSPDFDNYHRTRGARPRFTSGSALPVEDKAAPIARTLWRDTQRAYRAAAERLALVSSNQEVRVAEEDKSPDFSDAPVAEDVQPLATLTLSRSDWEPKIRKWSALFKGTTTILTSAVRLTAITDNRSFVDSAGTRIRHGRTFARITVSAQTKAPDGMNLALDRSLEAERPGELPADAEVEKLVKGLIADLNKLLASPTAEPYIGPAILSGKAAAVFFHEIFGHRMEGHRQKDEREGQTFTSQVSQQVLPAFLSVVADPTRRQFEKQDLMGWYAYDDEGVRAERVPLVEEGILRNFLMSRSPIEGFPASNGHGRRQPGAEVVSRQSNLIVSASQTASREKLRDLLIAELRRQGKPYGLLFADVTGGFTSTGRAGVQAFTVLPLIVYRVFVDGRPDEMIRGVDIVGTPLASFAKIVAAADGGEVFNGYCGAESGSIPVAAVSPALLVSEIETQKRSKAEDRPPLLPYPRVESDSR